MSSRRKWNLSKLIPRARGVYPINSMFVPPYVDDLYPIDSKNSVCGINNGPGRRSGVVQPDYCVTTEVSKGGIKFPSTIILYSFAFGIRIKNFIGSGAGNVLGGVNVQQSIFLRPNPGIRLNSSTYYRWDGSGDTEEVLTADISDVFFVRTGYNIKLWADGEYRGFITLDSANYLAFDKLLSGYTSLLYNATGDFNDAIIYKITGKTSQEITAYFNENACKFHVDNMPIDDEWKFCKWNMSEKGGTTIFNSGTDKTMPDGVLFYDDVTVPSEVPRSSTVIHKWVQNPLNRYGYTDNSGVLIPADMADLTKDVQGNALGNAGRVKYDIKVVGGLEATVTTSSTLSFSDLTGVTIVEQHGTAVAEILGNAVIFSVGGTIEYLELSDGTTLYFNGHCIDSKTKTAITNSGFTFAEITTGTTQATIDSLANTVYKDTSGNLIINPQYAATTETVLKGKGYKFVGSLDTGVGLASTDVTGHLPSMLLNLAAFDGNLQGFEAYWTAAVEPYIDYSNTYIIHPDILSDLENFLNEKGLAYLKDCNVLKDLLVYANVKTDYEQEVINDKGLCPTYTGLAIQMRDSNGNGMYDSDGQPMITT